MFCFSKYVIEYKLKHHLILVSMLTGTTLKLHDLSYIKEYTELKKQKQILCPNTDLEKALVSAGFLISHSEDVSCFDTKTKFYLNSTLKITILPTEQCNFRCTYCYEDFKVGRIPTEYVAAIKIFLENEVKTGKYKNVYINWFGGEPLLAFDIIEDIQNFALDLCSIYNLPIHSSITTNGYLLNKNQFQKLLKLQVTSFQITVDGDCHDQKRISVSGQGTYRTIMNNLKEIQSIKDSFHIMLRNNILKNQFDKNYYDELYSFISGDSRFSVLVREVKDWGNIKDIHSLSLITEKKEQRENLYHHLSYLVDKKINIQNFLDDLPFSSICYASYPHSYVFRANGDILKCTVHLNLPENKVGKIIDATTILWNEENMKYWHIEELLPKCHSCKYLISCYRKSCPVKVRKYPHTCFRTLN